jgi:predicted HTH transcriptional regulator
MTILDSDELGRILAGGEGRQVEFKEGLAADGRVARTICAFANTRGGMIIVGVSDKGAIRGVPRPGAVAAGLRALATDAVEPPVDVRVEVLRSGRASIVSCSVPLSPARPHALRRSQADWRPEVLIRAGSSNRAAGSAAIEELQLVPLGRTAARGLASEILRAVARSSPLTIATFARSSEVGKQKVRQGFEALERAGLLVAHGLGERRAYELP